MKLERKIELLKKSYLHGYAANFSAIDLTIYFLQKEVRPKNDGEELIETLKKAFDKIINHYSEIVPFYEITQEMKEEDWDDFATLFKVREVLPKVNAVLKEYFSFLQNNNYLAQKNCGVLKKFYLLNKEWSNAEKHQGMNLRARIWKYDPSFRSEYERE